MSRLPPISRVVRGVAAAAVAAIAPPVPAPEADRAPAVFVLVVAAGALGTPFVIGGAALLLLGELMPGRIERGLPVSMRGHFVLAAAAVALGLCGWLPSPAAPVARALLALSLVPLAYVPMLVHDPAITWRRAIARSIDLTMRSTAAELLSPLVLAAFLGPMVSVAAWLWSLGQLGWLDTAFVVRALVLGGIAIGTACFVGWLACAAVTKLAVAAADPKRHLRPLSFVSTTLVAFSAVAFVWLATLGIVVTRFGGTGIEPVVSVPVRIERAPTGPLLVMRRHDTAEFGVVLRADGFRHWIDTVDVASARMGIQRETPLGVADVAMTQFAAYALLALTTVLAGWLAWARLGWLRRVLGRSSVVRVRIRREDIHPGRHSGHVLREGAELVLVADRSRARTVSELPITGLPEATETDESEYIEASVVSRRAWHFATAYRDALPSPPTKARLIVGGPADAIVAARVDDIERVVVAAVAIVPVACVVTMLAS